MNPAPNSKPTRKDLECSPWEGDILALEVFTHLAERFADTEFILALHGSVPRGCDGGNDLDLMVVQWNDNSKGFSGSSQVDRILNRLIGPIMELDNIFLVESIADAGKRWHAKLYHQNVGNVKRIIDVLIVLL